MWGTRTFYFGDRITVGVPDLQRAIAWCQEKLKLRLTPFKSEDCEALLSFDKEDETGVALVLIPQGATKANVEQHPIHPILFTKKIEKVRRRGKKREIHRFAAFARNDEQISGLADMGRSSAARLRILKMAA